MGHISRTDDTDIKTHAVGTLKPNGLGIYDMTGNVWEWTDTKRGSYRVKRGGGWTNNADNCWVSASRSVDPGSRLGNLGFRLALSL